MEAEDNKELFYPRIEGSSDKYIYFLTITPLKS